MLVPKDAVDTQMTRFNMGPKCRQLCSLCVWHTPSSCSFVQDVCSRVRVMVTGTEQYKSPVQTDLCMADTGMLLGYVTVLVKQEG